MNYFENHIGDYAAATAHLTWDEDMAYTRLIRAYYHHEKPIPVDVDAACRLARANTASQKKAVKAVLDEFFTLEADGWHQKRCDLEIQAYREGEPEREIKKANEANRLKRHRDERAALFKKLTDAGHHAAWNINMSELRELVSRVCGEPPLQETPDTHLKRQQQRRLKQPATATHTHTHTHTHTQEPRTKNQETIPQGFTTFTPVAHEDNLEDKDHSSSNKTTARARVARAGPESGATWDAYAAAHLVRYGVGPVRNAKVNGQLAQLVKRLGADEAPGVAAFYVRHNRALYVSAKHPVDLLLRDAEGLRTEWATGRAVTDTEARAQDKRQTNLNAFAPLIAEAKAREQDGVARAE